MSKIVTRQKDLNSDHRRLGTNCVLRYFLLIYIMIPYVPHIKPYYACLACFFNVFTNSDIYPSYKKKHKADNSPPFSLVMKIHKMYIPRLKDASIEICVVSPVSVDMNYLQGHET